MTVKPKRRQEIVTLLVVFLAVLVVSALIVYSIGWWRRPNNESYQPVVQNQPAEINRSTGETRVPTPSGNRQNSGIIDNLFGTQSDGTVPTEGWAINIGHLTIRLMLAALLGAALAFRPRKRILALKRNPYVAQTQILLAIVAAALMIIVGDNAARAFGIFGAVSLVRFRTNIKDTKRDHGPVD